MKIEPESATCLSVALKWYRILEFLSFGELYQYFGTGSKDSCRVCSIPQRNPVVPASSTFFSLLDESCTRFCLFLVEDIGTARQASVEIASSLALQGQPRGRASARFKSWLGSAAQQHRSSMGNFAIFIVGRKTQCKLCHFD